MKISPNFSRKEMACKCGCGFDTVDIELIGILELIRSKIGAYSPSSVCRCIQHNFDIGGRSTSQHLVARAADILHEDPKKLYDFIDYRFPDKYGLGLYQWGIHIDTRQGKARWSH